jgi:hypothetical protein
MKPMLPVPGDKDEHSQQENQHEDGYGESDQQGPAA